MSTVTGEARHQLQNGVRRKQEETQAESTWEGKMQTQAKQTIWYSLYGRMVEPRRLEAAFRKEKAANGAPGIDGVNSKTFGEGLPER